MVDTIVGSQFGSAGHVVSQESASPAAACDQPLVLALREGEQAAYEVLIARFERPVYNLVARLSEDPADAADITQEVFLKIFRKIHDFRGESSLKTWIYRIAVNEARNHHRWFGRHKKQEMSLEAEPGEAPGFIDHLSDPGRSPLDLTLDHETRALIESALNEINPSFRAFLVLREIEALGYEEIAEILEISLGTVKSRIRRGREALREKLETSLDRTSQPSWRSKELLAR